MKRTFHVQATDHGDSLRYRASTPAELMDLLLRSRHRKYIFRIDQNVGYHTYRVLAHVKIGDLDSLDWACGEAFANWRSK